MKPAIVAGYFDPMRPTWVKSAPEYGWVAGVSPEHRPTLLFVGSPRLAAENTETINAVVFDRATGAFETHAIACEPDADWSEVLAVADAAIGFQHVGNAPVFAFKHPTIWHLALVPLPFHLHDSTLETCTDPNDRARARSWIKDNKYVLHMGNAYFMSAKGDVESS